GLGRKRLLGFLRRLVRTPAPRRRPGLIEAAQPAGEHTHRAVTALYPRRTEGLHRAGIRRDRRAHLRHAVPALLGDAGDVPLPLRQVLLDRRPGGDLPRRLSPPRVGLELSLPRLRGL